MAEHNQNLPEVISPSDEDTSEIDKFLDFLFTKSSYSSS